MNRIATEKGGNFSAGINKTFAPMREVPKTKISSPNCRMPDPWKRRPRRHHGISDILDDIKVY